jgi:hypothetical protein
MDEEASSALVRMPAGFLLMGSRWSSAGLDGPFGAVAKDVGSRRSHHRAADRPSLAEPQIGFRALCDCP